MTEIDIYFINSKKRFDIFDNLGRKEYLFRRGDTRGKKVANICIDMYDMRWNPCEKRRV